MSEWKVGDWVVFDRSIGQIKAIREYGETFSDGSFETSGRLRNRFRPLTLRNKCIAESFDFYYRQLDKINGSQGFNYPDISQHFSQLALDCMDDEAAERDYYTKAQQFIVDAREYKTPIQGVPLFRPVL